MNAEKGELMQQPTPTANRYSLRRSVRGVARSATNPPDERTPFDPARFPGQRQSAEPFDLPQSPPVPIIEETTLPTASDAPTPRRRGRPRKQPLPSATDKVGYDPNPTVIDDPPECDESVSHTLPTATDSVEKTDGQSTRKRIMPETSAYPSPTGNPAMGTLRPQTGRKRQRSSVGTPEEIPDRSGVRDLPERMFTPSRATEIEATPMPDYPLAHDGDEPIAGNVDPQNLQGVSSKFDGFSDLDGEDFDIDQNARNLRTVPRKTGKKRETDPQSFRLPSRSVINGTDTPVRRRSPHLPEAPIEPEAPIAVDPPTGSGGVRVPTREPDVEGSGREQDAESPDRERKERSRRPVRYPVGFSDEPEARKAPQKNGGDGRRYYDDGALCGWLTDPEYGNASMGNDREQFHCISIIGQIEGHSLLPEGQKATKYEHIIPTLVSVEEDDRVDGLLVILNTMGGDVEAGLAIAEMIASMTKPTVSLVLGGGHSIGVPLATAAKYSLIVPSATMTIHPVRVSGMVIGVPQSFRYMSEMQERITKFICSHSKASPDDIRELMMRPDQIATDCGSILEGNEAVRYGIIDEVGGLDRALAVLREMCEKKRGKKLNKE